MPGARVEARQLFYPQAGEGSHKPGKRKSEPKRTRKKK
jgi:hypothetical protein